MPREIEQNDVIISTLFKWNKKFTIQDSNGNDIKDVYVRLVGDAELNRARVYALRKSSEMRRKLHDPTSDEYLAYIPEIDLIEDEVLVESALMQWTRVFANEAIKEIQPQLKLPAIPDSDASLEEQEKYQKEVDEWPQKREDMLREIIEHKIDKKREDLKILPKEVIYKEYKTMIINKICEEEMLNAYRDMCAYLGTYEDESYKKLAFKSFEEFANSVSDVKSQVLGAYLSLEIEGEDLKKSLGVTQ